MFWTYKTVMNSGLFNLFLGNSKARNGHKNSFFLTFLQSTPGECYLAQDNLGQLYPELKPIAHQISMWISFTAIPRLLRNGPRDIAWAYLASCRCGWPLHGAEAGRFGPVGYGYRSGYQHRTCTSQLQVGSEEWWQGSPGDWSILQGTGGRRTSELLHQWCLQVLIQAYIHPSSPYPSTHSPTCPSSYVTTHSSKYQLKISVIIPRAGK